MANTQIIPTSPLEWALKHASEGRPVFPLHDTVVGRCSCGKTDCGSPGKHPRTKAGFKDATTDEGRIRGWWILWPTANIGICTGKTSGITVVDLDSREAEANLRDVGLNPPETYTVRTRRGFHLYLPYNPAIRQTAGLVGHCDIRNEGGYVLGAGSVVDGKRYEVVRDLPIAEWPELAAFCQNGRHPTRTTAETPGEPIPEGQRNATLTSFSGTMRRRGMTVTEIEAALLVINMERCKPPLPEDEVKEIARSVARYSPNPGEPVPGSPSKEGNPETTAYTAPKKLSVKNLTLLLAEPAQEIRWQWDGILPSGGISLLAAKPKVGKSTLAQALALRTGQGAPFLGIETRGGPVLYVAAEGKQEEIKAAFRRLGGDTSNVFVHVGPVPFSPEVSPVDLLFAAVSEIGAVLVILDTLFRFLPSVADLNDYAIVNRAIAPLEQVARTTDCHIMALHHRGKSEREGGDDILGSTALLAAVDTALILTRHPAPDQYRDIRTVQRYGTDLEPTVVTLDEVTGEPTAGPLVDGYTLAKARNEVWNVLAGEPGLSRNEIDERVNVRRETVMAAIRGMVSDGVLHEIKEGRTGKLYPNDNRM